MVGRESIKREYGNREGKGFVSGREISAHSKKLKLADLIGSITCFFLWCTSSITALCRNKEYDFAFGIASALVACLCLWWCYKAITDNQRYR
jgi:hypothetical protein